MRETCGAIEAATEVAEAAVVGGAADELLAAADAATCAKEEVGLLAASARLGGWSSAEGGPGDHDQNATAPARISIAIARYPSDARQGRLSPSGPGGVGPGPRRPDTRQPGVPQGAGGLLVETAHPMRSWPYWFQMGLLPAVNEL